MRFSEKPFVFTGTHWKGEKTKFFDGRVLTTVQAKSKPCDWSKDYAMGLITLLRIHPDMQSNPVKTGVIPFQNGILDVTTGEFSDITSDNATTWCSPLSYDTTAKCPKFIAWLNWALEEDEISIKLVQAFIYLTLIGKTVSNLRNQKYLELIGQGGTGKSTFMRILTSLIGNESIGNTTFEAIQKDKFAVASLVGKSLILFSE